jgi:hypothetical protein
MKPQRRIPSSKLSRCLLVFCASLLLIFSFTSCDLHIIIPSVKKPQKKSDLLTALENQFATIQRATITLSGDDIIFYFDKPIDAEYLKTTIRSVFDKFTVVTDDWNISIKGTAYSPQTVVEELMKRIDGFSHIWEEEVSYSAQVTYKGYPFNLSGEFVFQDIHTKLLSTEKLAEFYRDAYLATHRSTIELRTEDVGFENATAVIKALSDHDRLLEISQDLLTAEKKHLEDLLEAIQNKATDEENQLISSWRYPPKSYIIEKPFTYFDNPKTDLLSYIDVEGLRQTHTLAFYDKDGNSETLYPSDGASTFIVYMEATPKNDSVDPISAEVIIKIGSVSIKKKGTKLYTIEEAIEIAGYDDIFVRYNTSFASKEVAEKVYGKSTHRIGSPTTVVLPYDGTLSSGVDDTPGNDTAGSITRSKEYVRLTVPDGITIDLKGRLVVNAKRASIATKFQGHVTGPNYSVLHLEKNSKINVEYRGELYALGFVEGDGEIEVESGGYVYEGLFISSFRGGTATVRIEEDVFPFDQYTVMQIEAPLIINKGAHYIAKALIFVREFLGTKQIYHSGDFPLAGPSALIRLSGGQLEKTFDVDSGHVIFTFNGNGTIGNSGVQVGSDFASTTGRAIPFDGTWHFRVASGNKVTIDAKVALLPGSSLTIENGAEVVVKKGSDRERGRNELTIFSDIPYTYSYTSYPNGGKGEYYRTIPTIDYTKDSKAKVDNYGTITIEENSGIAGHVTGSGSVVLKNGSITTYDFYIVEGSADSAKAKPITVTYRK